MKNTRRTSLSWILRELESHFSAAGWQLLEKPKTSLDMRLVPERGIEHTLLIHEPFLTEDLPSGDLLGIACSVNVYFEKLERTINAALERDIDKVGKLSIALRLSQLAPRNHLFAGNVHLIQLSDDVTKSVQIFLQDFSDYLEPIRRKLAALSVFAEDALSLPGVDPWSWSIRRAAYLHLYGAVPVRAGFLAELEQRSAILLAEAPRRQEGTTSLIANPAALKANVARCGAEDALRVAAALKATPPGKQPRRGGQ